MFCSHCGAVIPEGSQFCPQCGGSCAEPQASAAQPEVVVNDPQNIAKRTRDLKHLCAVLWITVGILLCLTCVGIVAGIWNIIYGAKALKFADTIRAGDRSVYAAFDSDLNSLTVGLILNLILGLGLGCALAILELFLRDRVLKNKEVFGA